MRIRTLIGLLTVLCCTIWLGLNSLPLAKDLSPQDFTIIQGAEFKPGGLLHVERDGFYYREAKRNNKRLIPFLIIPFWVIFLFALKGCFSFMRGGRRRFWVGIISVVLVLLCGALLTHASSRVSKMLFPDTASVIAANKPGGYRVDIDMNDGTQYRGLHSSWEGHLIPAFGVPFLIILALAWKGCFPSRRDRSKPQDDSAAAAAPEQIAVQFQDEKDGLRPPTQPGTPSQRIQLKAVKRIFYPKLI